MPTNKLSYHCHRFLSEILSYAIWLYHRFCLCFRKIEELFAKRRIFVTFESIRQWCQQFEPDYEHKVKKCQVVQSILGISTKSSSPSREKDTICIGRSIKRRDLFILVQPQRNQCAAERFFLPLLKGQGGKLRQLVTDQLRSYDAAHREAMPTVGHINHVYTINRAEMSHQPTKQQE